MKSITKKIKIEKIFILLLVLYFTLSIFSQEKNKLNDNPRFASINLIARVDIDSIVLRWAPSKPGGWIIANRIGYIVEKVEVNTDKPFNVNNYKRLNNLPLKPLSLDNWKATTSKENTFSAIAAQAVYGKSFIAKPLDESNLNALKNASDELMNRYSFALFAADNDAFTANALGLRLVDKDIKKGSKYIYRVYVAEMTNEYSFDTAYVFVEVKPFEKYPSPKNIRYESGDGNIKIFWEKPEEFSYSGYYIFRSEDNGKTYHKLNNIPFVIPSPENVEKEVTSFFVDTMTINYKQYKYKIFGVTPFGELSNSSEITAISKDLTPPPTPIIKKTKQISDREVKISWGLNNITSDFKGFVISRSTHSIYGYQIITPKPLPANIREYIDDLSGYEEMYYIVGSVDTAGNVAFSLPVLAKIIDTTPPLPPKGLIGEIDNKGIVTLKWNLGSEKNLLGYRILRANDPSHEFQQLTSNVHKDTMFIDTINIKTLTRNIYYRIVAVNNRYQHSVPTPILKIKRPDIIPPVEAVFKDIFVTDTSVLLYWYPSSSEDLAKQVLIRKLKEENNWTTIDTLPPNISLFSDEKVEKGKTYLYSIISIDSSGLNSAPCAFVMARPYETGKRPPVVNFKADYDINEGFVILTWTYMPLKNENYWFVIYKGKENEILKEYKAIKGDNYQYTFKEIIPKNTSLNYGIRVLTSKGGESEMVIVNVKIN